ncbi:MAG TPA: hypothetical protein VJR06_08315 [Nitrososphaerales archaeon]|nr:hypothetical protein [Nitrososphaerales archaeon]
MIQVTYGDTTVGTGNWWHRVFDRENHPSEKELRRAIAKAVEIHDRGSYDEAAMHERLIAEFS